MCVPQEQNDKRRKARRMKLLRDKILHMAKELRQSGKAPEVAQCPGLGTESSEVRVFFATPGASGLASVGSDAVEHATD